MCSCRFCHCCRPYIRWLLDDISRNQCRLFLWIIAPPERMPVSWQARQKHRNSRPHDATKELEMSHFDLRMEKVLRMGRSRVWPKSCLGCPPPHPDMDRDVNLFSALPADTAEDCATSLEAQEIEMPLPPAWWSFCSREWHSK